MHDSVHDPKYQPQNTTEQMLVTALLGKLRGDAVEYFCKISKTWVPSTAENVIMHRQYRLKAKETSLPITPEMWAMLDDQWQYAAMDDNGDIYIFTDRPDKRAICWAYGSGDVVEITQILKIDITGIDWATSLTKRPA